MARQHNHGPGHGFDSGTIIGAGVQVSGRVSGEEDLHVEGRIDGAVALSQTLYVAAGGIVAADVDAHSVVVSGVVVGNVTAQDCVTLHVGAKLVGDITAPRLIMADGAGFRGQVHMGDGSGPASQQAARTGAVSRPAAGSRARAGSIRDSVAEATRGSRRAKAPAVPTSTSASASSHRDDDVTVVVRHVGVAQVDAPGRGTKSERTATGSGASQADSAAPKKKLPPVARIPKPGKRRVNKR